MKPFRIRFAALAQNTRLGSALLLAATTLAITILAITALPLHAGDRTEFRVRPTRDYNPGARQGWCSIRLWVDDEVNIFQRGDRLLVETVRGRHPYDAGSECSGPLPRGPMQFSFRGVDGRGQVDLIQAPSPRNGFRSWVRIMDRKGGGQEHHFQIFWSAQGGSGWNRSKGYKSHGSNSHGYRSNDDWDGPSSRYDDPDLAGPDREYRRRHPR